jgi:hypothetical protein
MCSYNNFNAVTFLEVVSKYFNGWARWISHEQPGGQVDCLGAQARLVIEGDGRKVTRLLIRDPSQVSFAGGGEQTFTCGTQKPARRVMIDYYVKPDAKLGTAGEAVVIEFR